MLLWEFHVALWCPLTKPNPFQGKLAASSSWFIQISPEGPHKHCRFTKEIRSRKTYYHLTETLVHYSGTPLPYKQSQPCTATGPAMACDSSNLNQNRGSSHGCSNSGPVPKMAQVLVAMWVTQMEFPSFCLQPGSDLAIVATSGVSQPLPISYCGQFLYMETLGCEGTRQCSLQCTPIQVAGSWVLFPSWLFPYNPVSLCFLHLGVFINSSSFR